jgi:hypothetical protein
MKRIKTSTVWLLMLFLVPKIAWSQVIIFTGQYPPNGDRYVFQIDLATCQYCPILPTPFAVNTEVLMLPNGNIVVGLPNISQIFDPPNPFPIATLPSYWNASIVHPNGNIYVTDNITLMTYDPTTNTTTNIGNFPPGVYIDAFFIQGTTLYGFGYAGPGTRPIYQINLTNPALSVQVIPFVPYVSSATSAPTGQVITSWVGGGGIGQVDFSFFNPVTFTSTVQCQIPLTNITGMNAVPTGTPVPGCICLSSSAGTAPNLTAKACVPLAYTAVFNNDTQLDPDDAVGYILYTDPASPTTSVLFQNNTGIFPYVPPLTVGTTYYVSRIVGNTTGGQVSLTDPCLDISLSIALVWGTVPQFVSMTGSATNLCPGQCQDITLQVSGTPPFSIGWQLQQGGSIVTPTQFLGGLNSSTISFQACAPLTGTLGPINLVLCGLVDAFCINQP